MENERLLLKIEELMKQGIQPLPAFSVKRNQAVNPDYNV